jgi:hypothetical protein
MLPALLKAEGFTDIQYVKLEPYAKLGSGFRPGGYLDGRRVGFMARQMPASQLLCWRSASRLPNVGTERVRSIRDLKDKTVPVSQIGDPGFLLTSTWPHMSACPVKDINWIERLPPNAMQLLAMAR